MRIDKFLKNSRIIKRRQVAKEACENGRVLINGNTAKPGSLVNEGDIIEVTFGKSNLKVKVTNLIDGAKKSTAEEMYEAIDG
ncbi:MULTISPECIES: RNA-binding S4 domain-containing protein [Anaerococcus]|jgi:RNA-binding S4 domain protein|uniref:RQC P-site tRNA stabilizing factor n=1 Tax=Anaerococcus octavius TaxID=54007 RepID=A0A2I1M3N2_9FIRM|nr:MULTISPECIES: RNA-binding S4 domain-containing protein [Anaerococcus]MBS6106389.1 RNA-binding S4 domain-containing protein [Anaerococcus sp.]MDU0894145.1 RNA-binding S4 domain-containing protein [Anaerococcus sp.]MDU2599480.1 RNA-binding S4 domain-containing protein [Anaerococcus sp.]MDU5229753.1 RNA-binding S4 domain-containing protein [Anaerococcus sp.]MDU5535255.1 RNA-binding S4 domain-containing protein [Anaerococcus sp.]